MTAYQFAVPKSFPLGSPPETEEVRQVTTYLDALGRPVQARERLGPKCSGSALWWSGTHTEKGPFPMAVFRLEECPYCGFSKGPAR